MSAVEVFGCPVCGIPRDALCFDVSSIVKLRRNKEGVLVNDDDEPKGSEFVLARFDLPRNYCGILQYFAQFTEIYARDPSQVQTEGLEWQIRHNGQPQHPYLTFDRIINPWGLNGFPIALRLEESAHVEFLVRVVGDWEGEAGVSRTSAATGEGSATGARRKGDKAASLRVGGRLLGRYWYNAMYGGSPNPL